MPLGIGIDIVKISRFARMMDLYPSMIRLAFGPRERSASTGSASEAASWAASWAAKEAFLKALGDPQWSPSSLQDVALVSKENGSISLALGASAQREFRLRGGSKAHVAVSVRQDLAMALVVLE